MVIIERNSKLLKEEVQSHNDKLDAEKAMSEQRLQVLQPQQNP